MTFNLKTYLENHRARVNDALNAYLPRAEAEDHLNLREAMRGAVLQGGKRLRPCLVLAACEAVGGEPDAALPSACALEMVHAYSLVHDDLPSMDDDDLRRGQPTCHKKYGEAAAILAGDALLTLAFSTIAEAGCREGTGDAMRWLESTRELGRVSGVIGMVGGQARDMAIKEQTPDFETIEACHLEKTAALFAGAGALGALAGGGNAAKVSSLREYGQKLGLAFQHADDLLDADFPEYVELSRSRCETLTEESTAIAAEFGNRGIPLVHLSQLVLDRARNAQLPGTDSE